MSSAPPDSGSILKTKMPCDPASHVSNHKGISALLQNSVEKYLDRRRRGRSEPGATSPRRMVMRHGGGRGAEVMFRGAEPLCGCAAQGRKRAGRGYMPPLARVEHGLTLWQRVLPLKPHRAHSASFRPCVILHAQREKGGPAAVHATASLPGGAVRRRHCRNVFYAASLP